jgi:hypothetical protein
VVRIGLRLLTADPGSTVGSSRDGARMIPASVAAWFQVERNRELLQRLTAAGERGRSRDAGVWCRRKLRFHSR